MDDKDYESDSTVLVEDLSKNPEKTARKRRRLDAAIRKLPRTNIHESDVENTTPNVPNANLPIDRRDRNNDPERDWIMNKYFDSSNNNNDSTAEEDLKIKRELLKEEYDKADDIGNYEKDDGDVANDCVVISDDSDDDCTLVTNEQVDKNTSLNLRISVLTPSAINNRRATLDSLESNENPPNVNSVNTAYPNKVNPKLTVLKPAAINARRSTFTCFERNVAAIKKTVQDNVTKCDNFTSNENKNKEINDNNKTKETNNEQVHKINWLSGQKSYGEHLTKLNKNKTPRKRNIEGVIQGIKDSQAKNTVLSPKNNDINNKEKAGVIKTANRSKSTDSSDVMRIRADVFGRNNQGIDKIQERVDVGEINSKDPSRTDAVHDKTVKMNDIDKLGEDVNVTKNNNINNGIKKNKETTNQVKNQTDSAKKSEVIDVIDRSKNEKEESRKRSKSIDAKRDAVDRCALNTDASHGNGDSNTDDVGNPRLQKLKNNIEQYNKTNIVQAENTNELDNEQSNRGPDRHENIDSNKITETNNREKKVWCADNRSEQKTNGNSNIAINTNDRAPAKSTARKSTCNMSVKSKQHEVTNLIVDDVTTKSNTLTNKTAISASNDVSTKTSKNQNKQLTSIEKNQKSCTTMPNKMEWKSNDNRNSYKRKVQDNTSPIKPKQVRTNAIEQDESTTITGICNNQTELSAITAVPSNLLVEFLPSNNSGNNIGNSDTTTNTERRPNRNETVSGDNNDTYEDKPNSKAQISRNQVESFTKDKDSRNTSKEKLAAPLTEAKANFVKNKDKDDGMKTAVAQYTCSTCSCIFDSRASLLDHVDNSHPPEIFTEADYMEHAKEHDPDDTEVVNGNIATEITTNGGNVNVTDADTQQQSNKIPCPGDNTEVVGGNIASEITTNKNVNDATQQHNSEISRPLCNVPLAEANYMEHEKEHNPSDREIAGGNIATEITTNDGNANVTDADIQQQNKAIATSNDEKQYECRICKEIVPSSAKEKHRKQVHGHLDYKNMQLFKATKKKVAEPKQANVIQSSACREDAVNAVNNPTLGSKEKISNEDLDNEMNRREENGKNEVNEVAAKTRNNVEKDRNFEQNIIDGTDPINAQNLNSNDDTQMKTSQERKRKADDEHINIVQEANQAHENESQTEKTMYKYKCLICKTLFTDYGSRKHRKNHLDFANKHLFDKIKVNADGQIDEQNDSEVNEEIRTNKDEISLPNRTIVDAHETTESHKTSGDVDNVKQSHKASVNDIIPTNSEMESEPLSLNETNTFGGVNVGAESSSQVEFHETRTLGDNDLNTNSTEDSNRENISDHAHPENSSVSGSDADVSQNVDDTVEDEVSREQPNSKYIYPSKSERCPPLANCYNCWTNIEVNDMNNHDCRQKIVGNLYNCFSCGVNIQRDDMHQCKNENNCIEKIQITNIVTVKEVYVFKCEDCNSATDVYDDVIRHCQNHYNGKTDPVAFCKTCQMFYNVDTAHEHLHGKEVTIINYSYKSLFSNWDGTFDGIPAHVVKEMQLRSIYRSHCVKMSIVTEGPWLYSLYQCKQCETCVPPSKIDQHCQQQCSSVAYPCSICEKLFTSDTMCSNHELDHRTTNLFKVIEFNCKKDERFNRKLFEARKIEMASRIHVADIFKCQCGLCFISNETFRKHFACCDLESDKGTICYRCVAPRIFEPNELEIHLSLHHSSVAYRFRVNSISIQQEIETFDVLDGGNGMLTQDGSAANDIKVGLLKVDIQERTV